MLESLVKCYLADLKYPDKTFFYEKLELLEKETKLKNDKNIFKKEHDFMEEFDKKLGSKNSSIKLWGKLSQDWIHTKGFMDKIINGISEKSGIPPAYALPMPMNLNKSELETISELQKCISQFRILLKATISVSNKSQRLHLYN